MVQRMVQKVAAKPVTVPASDSSLHAWRRVQCAMDVPECGLHATGCAVLQCSQHTSAVVGAALCGGREVRGLVGKKEYVSEVWKTICVRVCVCVCVCV